MKEYSYINEYDNKEHTVHLPETPQEVAKMLFDIQVLLFKPLEIDNYKIYGNKKAAKDNAINNQIKYLEEIKMKRHDLVEFNEKVIDELRKINIE